MDAAAPKHIDKYEVVGLIGRGGMGVVYKAIDRSLNRLVAIKMVTQPDQEDGEALKRFYREAQFTANLRHANIVTVYQLGDFEGHPYLVMEYLAGQSLDSMLARQPMTLLQKLGYVRQVCNGLQYAHTRQPSIVHRDIKPGNVVVVEDGTVKIVDFGIAKMGNWRNTRVGQLMGSYHYMSPEQISDEELDGRTDIFSTGVVLYQLLTLTLPFEGSGIAQTLHRIVHSPPLPLGQFLRDYPPELDDIVSRALAKNSNDRYQAASDFAYEIAELEEKLRKQLFGGLLESAESFLHNGDFENARQKLTEVLKSDANHTRANELVRQVQQAEARSIRKKRARELRVEAEHCLEQHSLTGAVNSLEEAVKLDNSDTELRKYREHVVALYQKAEKVKEALAKAERAFAKDDLEGAAAGVADALALEPDTARARSLKALIEAKFSERETEGKVRLAVEEAKRQISSLDFSEALQTLHNAQALDPNYHGLASLVRLAENGYQRELRKVAMEKSMQAIKDALERGEPSLGLNLAMAALESFPGESLIEKLRDAAEEQIEAQVQSGNEQSAEQDISHRAIDLPRWEPTSEAPLSLSEMTSDDIDSGSLSPRVRNDKKREPSVAELTPLEGIDLPLQATSGPSAQGYQAAAPTQAFASQQKAEAELQSDEMSQDPESLQWSEATLKKVEERLALLIGPLASIVVKKAAASTRDTNEFYRKIADKISDTADREAFLAQKIPFGGSEPKGDSEIERSDGSAEQDNVAREVITRESIERGARLLLVHCGPISHVLAKKAAQNASNLRSFHKALSEYIENDADRKQFLQKLEMGHH